jgi:hypothetical protein
MADFKDVKIAVIGGSGLYNLEGLEVIEEVNPETVSYTILFFFFFWLSTHFYYSLGVSLATRLLSPVFLAEIRLHSWPATAVDTT